MLEQLLNRNVKRFRGGLVCKAHRLLNHSTLGMRATKKTNSVGGGLQVSAWWRHGRMRACSPATSPCSTGEPTQPSSLYRNVKRFRGGLVCKAHRLLNHSTLGSRIIKKKKTARRAWACKTGAFLRRTPPREHSGGVTRS